MFWIGFVCGFFYFMIGQLFAADWWFSTSPEQTEERHDLAYRVHGTIAMWFFWLPVVVYSAVAEKRGG